MAAEPEDPILDAEDEGGPVKGFLEHLEDLRWVLLKSFAALMTALLVCLLAAPTIVGILKYPLEQSAKLGALYGNQEVSVAVRMGTNSVGVFKPGKEYLEKLGGATLLSNRTVTVDILPIVHGTNHYLGFTLSTNAVDYPHKAPVELLNLSPAAGFFVALQVAFYGGLVFSSPFILFFIAQFVLPALKVNELRYVRKAFIFGIGLFITGLALCYFVMLPIGLKAAVWFSNQMGFGAFQWTADTYIGFVTKFMLAMGIGFELPIFLLLFVKLGLLSYKTLASNRKIVFVVILIVAAVLTPPDVVTQIAMTIPLYGLFEITTLIAWWWERKDKKIREAEEAAEEAERQERRARRNREIAAATAVNPEGEVKTPSPDVPTPDVKSGVSTEESTAGETATAPAGVAKATESEGSSIPAVEDHEFVDDGEPVNPPYIPPVPDAGYAPYAEALAQSESAEKPKEEESSPEPEPIPESERNPDIPL